MARKHKRTLAALFEDPVRSDILWSDIMSMLANLGAVLEERAGSRVRVTIAGKRATFHRPHPQKETKRRTVRNIRRFLSNAGIRP